MPRRRRLVAPRNKATEEAHCLVCGQQGREVRIRGDDHSILFSGEKKDRFVVCALKYREGMRDTDLFQLALGLKSPWMVTRSEYAVEDGQLDLYVDFPRGSRFACAAVRRLTTRRVRWRDHLSPSPRAATRSTGCCSRNVGSRGCGSSPSTGRLCRIRSRRGDRLWPFRHCEEQSDEAIQKRALRSGLLRFARNDKSCRARTADALLFLCDN